MIRKLKKWLIFATAPEKKALAKHARISPLYLWHLANGYRNASAEMAAKIEYASERLHAETNGHLPKISRADICRTCARCPHNPHNKE
jgi:hypothetical protein